MLKMKTVNVNMKLLMKRKWVQANLGVETKEEYYDLVANGNLRTPYIPKEPERYYKLSGTWISWHHFLNVKCEH